MFILKVLREYFSNCGRDWFILYYCITVHVAKKHNTQCGPKVVGLIFLKIEETCFIIIIIIIIIIKKKLHWHIQGVPGGKDLTSGECSLGQTIPI
jgi:hypothetical protein